MKKTNNNNYDNEEIWKCVFICERIQDVGREPWKGGFNDTEYARMMQCPKRESFADVSFGYRSLF